MTNPTNYVASKSFIANVGIGFARQFSLLGVDETHDAIGMLCLDDGSWQQMDAISRLLRLSVTPVVRDREEIQHAINAAYQEKSAQTEEFIESLPSDQVLEQIARLGDKEDLLDNSDRSPVIKLVNMILFEAAKVDASDIHIQPYENELVVRFRIDGVLFDSFNVPKSVQEEVISRVKVLGKMNIAEKRLPQDGRATVQAGDRMIDLRIASLPANHGERVVIRLLDKGARLLTLTEIGMDDHTLSVFRELIHVEHGLILVTGPTGSGKTTTLYGALQEINTTDRNVITLEDPIEYQMEGISQSQINETKGMTFAKGLRNVLRQDPDIIMVGEIRDHETAVMAIQSALTGHLVFSTLHTNDAASAVTRLLDLGIEPYLASSSLIAVMAQRLVRCVCKKCGKESQISEKHLKSLGCGRNQVDAIVSGAGCDSCRETGYRGRKGLFELLVVNDNIRNAIQDRESARRIRDVACDSGMSLLRQDGLRKIANGITSVDEVLRVTMRSAM